MAYGAVVTWERHVLASGRERYNIQVVETECAVDSAWSTKDDGATNTNQVNQLTHAGDTLACDLVLPRHTILRSWKVSKDSGTAVTYASRLGKPETPGSFSSSTKDLLAEVAVPAAFIFEFPDSPLSFTPLHVGGRYLSGMSVPDTGTDNTVRTHLVIDTE